MHVLRAFPPYDASQFERSRALATPHHRERLADVLPLRAPVRDAPPDTASLLRTLRALHRRARDVDVQRLESRATAELAATHVPSVIALLDELQAALLAVAARYGARGEPDADEALELDALLGARDTAARVADLAIIARAELAYRHERLREVPADACAWDHIAAISSARRRALRSLALVERAICDHERLACESSWRDEALRRSLEIRRVYAAFRRRLDLARTPAKPGVRARMRRAGVSLAVLVGEDCYEHLRTSDRRTIRALQASVRDWLRVNGARADRFSICAGERIWRELHDFAERTLQVNDRAELREHDAATLQQVADGLLRLDADADVPSTLRARLRPLAGADAGVDDCIGAPDCAPVPAETLRAYIDRVITRQRLG
ncbi:MAG: hypothetical protein H6713_14095 [Myxococcales bacterium]|nr:hypothetical protein [Myxococcales bacterium]